MPSNRTEVEIHIGHLVLPEIYSYRKAGKSLGENFTNYNTSWENLCRLHVKIIYPTPLSKQNLAKNADGAGNTVKFGWPDGSVVAALT